MGILRADRVGGLGGANAINGSVFFGGPEQVSGGVTSNNILITEVSSDFTFGTGDFTIEGWFYTPDLSNWNLLLGDNVYQSTGGWSLYLNTDPDVDWWKGAASVVSGATPTVSTWHHIAFSRASGTNRVFLDGALGASASDSTDYTGTQILIGANQLTTAGVSQWGFKGYVSNLRVIKGEAIYTAAFTVPTSRLEKTDNTVLLCCQSPGNVLQEATGKTLYTLNKPVASHFSPDVGEDHGTTFEDNTKFDTLSYMVPPGGTTAESNRGFAVFGGGITPSVTSMMDYCYIPTMGNLTDWGDLTGAKNETSAFSSSTRGVWAGGTTGTYQNVIEYITFTTQSSPTDFGDLTVARGHSGGTSNSTRGLVFGGYDSTPNPDTMYNTIDYVTIASTGDATDFGDSTVAGWPAGGARSSTTRAVAGGYATPSDTNTIDYITIASTGDATNFGDLNHAGYGTGAGNVSNGTRVVFLGNSDGPSNTIDYITIATTGDATEFGDLTAARRGGGSSSTLLRGILVGGRTPSEVNTIDYVTIATTGNASDFGDATSQVSFNHAGCSDSHGGLS